MHPRALALKSALLVSAMGLAVGAGGVPVLLGNADAALSAAAAESSHAAPAAIAPLPPGVGPAGGESPIGVPRTGRGGAGPVAAADTTSAQGTGIPSDPTLPQARVNAESLRLLSTSKPAASAAVSGDDDGLDIELDLKHAAKTALDWGHEAKQWVQSATKGGGDGFYKDAAASGEHRPGGGAAAVGSGTAAINSSPGSHYSPGSEPTRLRDRNSVADANLVRDSIKLIRDLVENPVTWLSLPTLAFGMLTWQALLHRARAGTRRVKRRDRRGARALAQTGRQPGKGRPNGKTAGPPSIRRSGRG